MALKEFKKLIHVKKEHYDGILQEMEKEEAKISAAAQPEAKVEEKKEELKEGEPAPVPGEPTPDKPSAETTKMKKFLKLMSSTMKMKAKHADSENYYDKISKK